MKKLMIAAAIVCAAVLTQAAQINWSATKICDSVNPDDLYLSGGIARIFTVQDIAIDSLMADLAKGDFTKWNTYGADEKSVSGGSIALGDYFDKTAGTYDWYAVVLDAGTTADAKNFYVTASKEEKILDGAGNETSVKFGNQETPSYSGWQAIAVPEPTSGLLLLLGMAGLALRRRRA